MPKSFPCYCCLGGSALGAGAEAETDADADADADVKHLHESLMNMYDLYDHCVEAITRK